MPDHELKPPRRIWVYRETLEKFDSDDVVPGYANMDQRYWVEYTRVPTPEEIEVTVQDLLNKRPKCRCAHTKEGFDECLSCRNWKRKAVAAIHALHGQEEGKDDE